MHLRRRLVAVPRVVRTITALFAVVLVGWSMLAPIGQAPDETVHVDLVLHLATGAPYPDFDGRHPARGTVLAALSRTRRLGLADAPARSDRRTFAEWGGDQPTPSLNQIPQHPPLYYWLTSAALRLERRVVPGGPAPLDREWHVLRMMNVVMMAPLPLLAWATARRLRAGAQAAVTAAIVPLGIPQLTHIGASVNNDNLLVLLAAVLAFLLAGVLRGDARRSTAGWIALVTSLALLTKAFAFVFLPWIVVVYLVGVRRRAPPGRLFRTMAFAVIPPVLVGGAWVVRNIVRFGEVLPSTLDEVFARPVPGFSAQPGTYVREYVPGMARSWWGAVGGPTVHLAPVIVVVASLAMIGLALVGLTAPRRAPSADQRLDRRSAGALMGAAALLAVVLVVRDFEVYRHGGRHSFMQGRYLFTAVVPLAVLVGAGTSRLLARWAAAAVFGAASILQVAAAEVALRGWWRGPGVSAGDGLSAVSSWSPWPILAQAAVVAAIGVLWVATAWLLGRHPTDDAEGVAS